MTDQVRCQQEQKSDQKGKSIVARTLEFEIVVVNLRAHLTSSTVAYIVGCTLKSHTRVLHHVVFDVLFGILGSHVVRNERLDKGGICAVHD